MDSACISGVVEQRGLAGVEGKKCLALRGGGLLLFITFCILVPGEDFINTA